MAIKLNDHYLASFIRPHEYERIADEVRTADAMLRNKTGADSLNLVRACFSLR